MNRIKYVFLLCLAMATLGANAQWNTVEWYKRILLSHKGDLRAYEYDQIQTAVNDAVEGDTIYLNRGSFSSFYIDKPITIIGAGDDNSRIDGSVYVVIPNNPTLKADLLKGVYVDGNLYIGSSLKGLTIRNCNIWYFKILKKLYTNNPNGLECEILDNTVVDRCYIYDNSINPLVIKNIQFQNCHIKYNYMYYGYGYNGPYNFIDGGNAKFVNCRIDGGNDQYSGYHTSGLYINSIVNNEKISSDCIYIRCIIKSSNGTWQNSFVADQWTDGRKFEDYLENTYYIGTDGTPIGIKGGTTPYTLSTTAPKITNNIKTSIDQKKLNVDITATPVPENAEIVEHQYWMDDDYDKPKTVKAKSGEFTSSIPIGSMPMGYHYFNYRAKDSNGEWSSLLRYRFYSLGEDPEDPTETPIDTDKYYYLQNVETGLYLNQGNGWGTHAVLSEHGLPIQFSQLSDGSYTIYFMRGSGYDKLLFRDGADVYVDYDPDNSNSTQWCQYWTITNVGNDIYRIQSLITDDLYGQAAYPGTYLGNNPNKEAYAYGRTYALLGVYNDVDGNILAEEGMNINWRLVPVSLMAYLSEYELPNVIVTANNLGIDTSAAAALSGNIHADVGEVETCIATLRETIKQRMRQSSASATNPIEVTGLIQNPTFAWNGEEGWTVSEAKEGGTHQQALGVSEYWNSSFNYSQTITGLANGTYQIKVKAFHRPGSSNATVLSNYQQGIDKASAVLYGNNETVILANHASGAHESLIHYGGAYVNGLYLPNFMFQGKEWFDAGYYDNTMTVKVTDGKLDLGIKLDEEISGQWVVFDDFRLYYLGKQDVNVTDISQMDNAIYIDNTEVNKASQATISVKMKNNVIAEGFEFNLHLPNGIEVAIDEDGFPMVFLSTERTNSRKTNTFETVIQNDGSLHILGASTNGSTISGNDGEIVLVTVNVSDAVEEGSYPVVIDNIVVSDKNANAHEVESVTSVITIVDYTIGDVNMDGKVNVADYTAIAHHIMGNTPTVFNKKAADANNDGKINVADLTAVAHLIMYGSVERPNSSPMIRIPE